MSFTVAALNKKNGPGIAPGPPFKRRLAIHPPGRIAKIIPTEYYTVDGGICQRTNAEK
jgi:hypothetical protein